MWVLKLKLDASKQLMGSLAMKYNVSMTGYPLSYYKDKKFLYLVSAGLILGDEEDKKQVLRELKKNPEILEYEAEGDFIINISKQPLFTEPVYNPRIIRPEPVIISPKGYHIWTLASFDRKLLEKVIDFTEKKLGAKILKFKQEKISNISFTKLLPDLTDNQKKAMEIAISHGYYDYPKKINMEALAKMMNISYSTYQAHLKKAESKLIPHIYEEY